MKYTHKKIKIIPQIYVAFEGKATDLMDITEFHTASSAQKVTYKARRLGKLMINSLNSCLSGLTIDRENIYDLLINVFFKSYKSFCTNQVVSYPLPNKEGYEIRFDAAFLPDYIVMEEVYFPYESDEQLLKSIRFRLEHFLSDLYETIYHFCDAHHRMIDQEPSRFTLNLFHETRVFLSRFLNAERLAPIEIASLELLIQEALPVDFLNFLLKYSGKLLDDCGFKEQITDKYTMKEFSSFNEMHFTTESLFELYGKKIISFARFFPMPHSCCFSVDKTMDCGSIFFHVSTRHGVEDGFVKIADSIADFINIIKNKFL